MYYTIPFTNPIALDTEKRRTFEDAFDNECSAPCSVQYFSNYIVFQIQQRFEPGDISTPTAQGRLYVDCGGSETLINSFYLRGVAQSLSNVFVTKDGVYCCYEMVVKKSDIPAGCDFFTIHIHLGKVTALEPDIDLFSPMLSFSTPQEHSVEIEWDGGDTGTDWDTHTLSGFGTYNSKLPACWLHPEQIVDNSVFVGIDGNTTLVSSSVIQQDNLYIGGRHGIPDWLIRNVTTWMTCGKKIDGTEYELSADADLSAIRQQGYPYAWMSVRMVEVDLKFQHKGLYIKYE